MSDDATFEELYALGVPLALLASRYGKTQSALFSRAAKQGLRRPSLRQKNAVARDLRLARIRANINANPPVSFFVWEDRAA